MNPLLTKHTAKAPLAAVALLALPHSGEAAFVSYYIGVDGMQTIDSGEFSGLANPNGNRLTFLYAHPNEETPANNHYHPKRVFRYQPGTAASPVIETNPSNYLPEGSNPPLVMTAGSGLYDGKSVVREEPGNHFSLIHFKSTPDLADFAAGSGEHHMFNSSSGRWTGSLAGADAHLVLVSMTPGLNIGTGSSLLSGLVHPGDERHLGEAIDFSPVFWVDGNAAGGPYTADFKLVDESGTFGDPGVFQFRFNVVPEPSTAILTGVALFLGLRRRR